MLVIKGPDKIELCFWEEHVEFSRFFKGYNGFGPLSHLFVNKLHIIVCLCMLRITLQHYLEITNGLVMISLRMLELCHIEKSFEVVRIAIERRMIGDDDLIEEVHAFV